MPLFSKNDLKTLSTDASYQRGVGYYNEGAVRKITRTGNTFEGNVSGSYRYRVKLEIKNGNLLFDCSCPYDQQGICKHCVAFGLAVLDEDYTETSGYALVVEDAQIVEEVTDTGFEEKFTQIDTKLKDIFLWQLLSKDTDLRRQFIHFTQSKQPKVAARTLVKSQLESIREHIYEALSSLSFDEEMAEEYGNDYEGYYGEGEELDEMAEEMIQEVLEPPIKDATSLIRQGKLVQSWQMILGIYEGIRMVEDPEADEYSLFDGEGYQERILDVFDTLLKEVIAQISKAVFPEEDIRQSLDLLIERYKHHEKAFDRYNSRTQIYYQLKHFESLLMAFMVSPKVASYLQSLLEKQGLVDNDTAYVILHIAQLTTNETLWLKTAEDFAQYEPTIALQLLDKYRANGQHQHFIRIAGQAWEKNPVLFDEYILTHLKPDLDKDLYVKVLEGYTRRKQSIEHYKLLRQYLTSQQRAAFIKTYDTGYNYLFYVQLLETEERYPEIMQILKRLKDQDIQNFDKMLTTVAYLFPNECMDLVMEKSEFTLQSDRKGRDTYQKIVSWLKVFKNIPDLSEQLRIFSSHLYDQHSRLRALREELQNAGLVRGKK